MKRIAHAVKMQFGCDEELAEEFATPLARVIASIPSQEGGMREAELLDIINELLPVAEETARPEVIIRARAALAHDGGRGRE